MDGPVGKLIILTKISEYRPAHIYFLIDQPGHQKNSPAGVPGRCDYLDSVVVFGAKAGLIVHFAERAPGATPAGGTLDVPFLLAEYDFVLQPEGGEAPTDKRRLRPRSPFGARPLIPAFQHIAAVRSGMPRPNQKPDKPAHGTEVTAMSDDHEVLAACRRTAVLGELVADMSYEVMPFKNTERDVLAHVPTTVRLTVTATAAKGIDATLDLTERLVRQGYTAAPHLPARLFVDRHHVEDVVARLRHNRVSSIFVIGGDAPTPAGSYPDALSLLEALAEANHPFNDVGIGGYPEGHGTIPQEAIDLSMKQKALMATRAITQICFDAKTTTAWAGGMAASGIGLPIYVGMPGPVNRQKLMRISAGIGLGPSARFLQKQQSLLWRFLLPGGYNPTKLLKSLAGASPKTDTNIRGLHIFTFNELRKTELWRQQLLAPFIERDERP